MSVKIKLSRELEPSRYGEWGQKFVICEACGIEYKDDGIIRHILQLAKKGNTAHQLLANELLS